MARVTLEIQEGLSDAYGSCREFIQYRAHNQGITQREIASKMDMGSSTLSRKLAQNPNDSNHFSLDDFEAFITNTGDTSPITYLVEKYVTPKNRIQALQDELLRLQKRVS